MARLFLAVWPDAPARASLAAIASEVARRCGGRAVPAAKLHLTLAFLGEADPARVPSGALAQVAAQSAPFGLALDRLGAFARAGVAWAAPSEVPAALAAANRDLVRALADRGVATEARPYRPHVTLARRCERTLEGPIAPPVAWRVDRVVLMSSRLLSEGARYREVGSWPAD